MSKTFSLEQLTEGIRQRHLGAQNQRLVEKWSRTGLLRGLGAQGRENMSRLLENQAAQVLKETTSLSQGSAGLASSGDIRGFSNVAFPIVRRVFGGLVANELVSIQPMSLPSGLLFYLDYTYGTDVGDSDAPTYRSGQSIYNSPVGKGVRSGSKGVGGQYDLAGSGYSRIHKQNAAVTLTASGSYGGSGTWTEGQGLHATGTDGKLLGFDPQISSLIEEDPVNGPYSDWMAVMVEYDTGFANVDGTMVKDFALHKQGGGELVQGVRLLEDNKFQSSSPNVLNVRRLNRLGTWNSSTNTWSDDPLVKPGDTNAHILMIVSGTTQAVHGGARAAMDVDYIASSKLDTDSDGSTLTIPAFESSMADQGTANSPSIPEIDIKVESIAVTAVTRKLRAKWSPELAQDLNAYHSLDAEVELTQILSEQIALELDREILNDLLTQASGANLYWSRAPGKFVNKETGVEALQSGTTASGPTFAGTVREWYETLVETIIDVANQIHRKTLRGSANFIVVGPDVATILEASVYYRPSYSLDGEGQVSGPMSIGCEKVGTLSNRFTCYKDPYFPRNKILVGYKGGSYLETGYVYAPYVPLIVTPTIFNPDDFTPRKGVMTRYGKKMVRNDFYGTVTIMDLNVI